ncbi:MAG: crotonase/enoyl-CoA hydratase family protein [Pontixanthobacter sp.]
MTPDRNLLQLTTANTVATLTLDRPDAMNALGQAGDGDAFASACDAINADPDIRCVVLTGAGKAFSAGGDVKAMRDRTGNFGGSPIDIANGYRTNIHRVLRALDGLQMPLIAAVNGAAIGLGCDLACLADIRIASTRAKFGVTFLKLGIIPGDGGTWILPRVIGEARAAELFYTGDVIDAERALQWGLVSQVVDGADLMDAARTMAERIAAMPPHALRQTKMLIRRGRSIAYDTALELAANTQALMHHTSDHAEGVAALLEKRTPTFTGD